ncbi:DUF2797 domain-containing protein [Nocardia takedensis]|uniref:DUF2797 domain-containing protein n=1 Tax=Nocardia takedensis TaxID=259390 RepID=UPI0005949D17|nr:DUF2797 domain-containing protein [Nocardia takedensis]
MRASWGDGVEYLVRSVSWTGGSPHLDLLGIGEPVWSTVALMGAELAFTVSPEGSYCTGHFVFGRPGGGGPRHCAAGRLAVTGGQCAECATADEFRHIHHAHRGGFVPDGLSDYVAQPHWVYIATFADASSKVGTAAHPRKRARLDEQGAVRATYLAWAESGTTARVYEDMVSDSSGIVQTKRRRAKLTALTRPRPASEIEQAHAQAVREASDLLRATEAVLPLEPWIPPAEHRGLTEGRDAIDEYPHPLTAGDHRLTVVAMVGSAALVRVNDEDDPFVADLGMLKGRRVIPGPVRSPAISTQLGLF